MANIFNDPNRWTDNWFSTPSIYWNGAAGRYEILASSSASADSAFSIRTTDVSPGDFVEFVADFAELVYPVGSTQAYLNIVADGLILMSHPITVGVAETVKYTFSSPFSQVDIVLVGFSGSSTVDYFYGIEATLTGVVKLPGYHVYEIDRGWTFDGNYIPHYVVFNWYFGENPTVYTTMQKVRVHGLSMGTAKLKVQTSGIQTDYLQEFSDAEFLDLKNPYEFISEEFIPATNYADLANRGLAIQLKFEGRNCDLTLPEPSHVLQVLVPQSSPEGSGRSSN